MKKAITLIEIIFTIAIAGFLSVGMFQAIKVVTEQIAKARDITTLSIDTSSTLDILSGYLFQRIPGSVIVSGSHDDANFLRIFANNKSQTILEWLGRFYEAEVPTLSAGTLNSVSGFLDMSKSTKSSLHSPNSNFTGIKNLLSSKFDGTAEMAIIFAGSFDSGVAKPKFGWHKTNADDVIILGSSSDQNKFTAPTNNTAYKYEKYYITDSAYAVARGEDITDESCANLASLNLGDKKNSLLFFYDYRPWEGQTFCDGKVNLLSQNITGFRVDTIANTIRIHIDANIAKTKANVSKEKAIW